MFEFLLVISAVCLVASLLWLVFGDPMRIRPIKAFALGISLVMVVATLSGPSVDIQWSHFVADGTAGNWLVIDNSAGEAMRHWILEGQVVEKSSASNRYWFIDRAGNGPCYVSGNAFVMRINQPLGSFRKDYKQRYNIPEEQEAL